MLKRAQHQPSLTRVGMFHGGWIHYVVPGQVSVCGKLATVCVLPEKCSRMNCQMLSKIVSFSSPSIHCVTNLITSIMGNKIAWSTNAAVVKGPIGRGKDTCIVVICPRSHVIASACAIARACPLYLKKTTGEKVMPNCTRTHLTFPISVCWQHFT